VANHFLRMILSEIFGLIVRSCGLFLVYQGLQRAVIPAALLLSGNFRWSGGFAPAVHLVTGGYFFARRA